MTKEITIIGGGLAGLTLGLALRQREVPVTLWEAGSYPRHRVCGEFISGQGIAVLRRLGLAEPLLKAGPRKAETIALCFGRWLQHHRLPEPGLCLSRFHLDRFLAAKLEASGGHVRAGARYGGALDADGFVRATGRNLQAAGKSWHWYGIKAHARGVALDADLEMHYGANAYVGLCRLDEETVNVCGLYRRRASDPKPARELPAQLQGTAGTLLFERLKRAEWKSESICAVAGLSFGPLPSLEKMRCCVGDVFRMIPPLTGNGMSIAFESAELAAQPLTDYAQGRISWTQAEVCLAGFYEAAFRDRFFWANLLQKAAFTPFAKPLSIFFASKGLFNFCFQRTR